MFGTQPPNQDKALPAFQAYKREPTEHKEMLWVKDLIKSQPSTTAWNYVMSTKASQDKMRKYLQENKALNRIYTTGDWVLCIWQHKKKTEPFYDGPWAVIACHDGNTYSLASPGGIALLNCYNGMNLFPAYCREGHPVRSLWYASKWQLNNNWK
jgi:hypothetical protein